jgi:hypothetical protein
MLFLAAILINEIFKEKTQKNVGFYLDICNLKLEF